MNQRLRSLKIKKRPRKKIRNQRRPQKSQQKLHQLFQRRPKVKRRLRIL